MASVKNVLLKLCHLPMKAVTFQKNRAIKTTALKSNRANVKRLSVANDGDRNLKESEKIETRFQIIEIISEYTETMAI